MGRSPKPQPKPQMRRSRGFTRAVTLMQARIREAGASRGFSVSRLLTHWNEVAGEDIAAICRPVEVSYGRGGFGATLTLLTTGAQAPMLEMQKESLRERVNACYGHAAIARIRLTQTAPSGFAEGRASFAPAPRPEPAEVKPATRARAAKAAAGIGNDDLRDALEELGRNILSRQGE